MTKQVKRKLIKKKNLMMKKKKVEPVKILGVRPLTGEKNKAMSDKRRMKFDYNRFIERLKKRLNFHPQKNLSQVFSRLHFNFLCLYHEIRKIEIQKQRQTKFLPEQQKSLNSDSFLYIGTLYTRKDYEEIWQSYFSYKQIYRDLINSTWINNKMKILVLEHIWKMFYYFEHRQKLQFRHLGLKLKLNRVEQMKQQ